MTMLGFPKKGKPGRGIVLVICPLFTRMIAPAPSADALVIASVSSSTTAAPRKLPAPSPGNLVTVGKPPGRGKAATERFWSLSDVGTQRVDLETARVFPG